MNYLIGDYQISEGISNYLDFLEFLEKSSRINGNVDIDSLKKKFTELLGDFIVNLLKVELNGVSPDISIKVISPVISKTSLVRGYSMDFIKEINSSKIFKNDLSVAGKEFVVLLESQLLSPLVQNVFLKELEDSSKNYVFIGERVNNFLPTILSRSEEIKVSTSKYKQDFINKLSELVSRFEELFEKSKNNVKKSSKSGYGTKYNVLLFKFLDINSLEKQGYKVNIPEADISFISKNFSRGELINVLRIFNSSLARKAELNIDMDPLHNKNLSKLMSKITNAQAFLQNNCKIESVLYDLVD